MAGGMITYGAQIAQVGGLDAIAREAEQERERKAAAAKPRDEKKGFPFALHLRVGTGGNLDLKPPQPAAVRRNIRGEVSERAPEIRGTPLDLYGRHLTSLQLTVIPSKPWEQPRRLNVGPSLLWRPVNALVTKGDLTWSVRAHQVGLGVRGTFGPIWEWGKTVRIGVIGVDAFIGVNAVFHREEVPIRDTDGTLVRTERSKGKSRGDFLPPWNYEVGLKTLYLGLGPVQWEVLDLNFSRYTEEGTLDGSLGLKGAFDMRRNWELGTALRAEFNGL